MEIDTIKTNETNRTRKHDFHTISTSKNISKEKLNLINHEFSQVSIKNDLKANINNSKTKKVKNSLNSILIATLLPTSIVYPNVLDYICNNSDKRKDGITKRNSRKNKKFWTTIRKKKITEINIEDDRIINSSILSPDYAPSPSSFKNEDLSKTQENSKSNLEKRLFENNNDNNLQQNIPQQQQNIPNKNKSIENIYNNNNNNIPNNSSEINKLSPNTNNNNNNNNNSSKEQLNDNNNIKKVDIRKGSISKSLSSGYVNKNELAHYSSLGLYDNIDLKDNVRNGKDVRNKTFNVASMKKNRSLVTTIDTNVHGKNEKGYSSWNNLSVDDDNKSIMYSISPTLVHGELQKKIDNQFPTYSEQISNLKNTYIITRHNSIDIRKEKENKRSSLIKKSSESLSLNKQKLLNNSKRTSAEQMKHSSLIMNSSNIIINSNRSIEIINPDSNPVIKEKLSPNQEAIKNISEKSIRVNTDVSDLAIDSSMSTVTRSNQNDTNNNNNNNVNVTNETSAAKEYNNILNVIDSNDNFYSIDNMDSSGDISIMSSNNGTSQYFDVMTNSKFKNGNSMSSIPSISITNVNSKKTKTITESKLKNATTISESDDRVSNSSEENNEDQILTPKNQSNAQLKSQSKSTFSSFGIEEDEISIKGPLLTFPNESYTNNFSQNYLNNAIKQNKYSSTISFEDDDFDKQSLERKPTNLEKLQNLFINDDSSVDTKTGSKNDGKKKVANDYLKSFSNDFETWDEDFDGDFNIPDTVVNSQKILKQEIISFKSFAVNIEDIKKLYSNINEVKDKACENSDIQIQNSIKHIDEKYVDCIEKYEVLIDLAEQDENDDDSKISTKLPFERYITVLEELLNDNSTNVKKELDSEKIFSKDGNNINKNYIFGINVLPILLNNIEPIRKDLKDYYLELCNLLSKPN